MLGVDAGEASGEGDAAASGGDDVGSLALAVCIGAANITAIAALTKANLIEQYVIYVLLLTKVHFRA
jgi:hypothetical protein